MVESTHTSGLWPSLYEPFRHVGRKLSEWLAPASEAGTTENAYTISMELPGVEEDDITLAIDASVVTVTGEKKSQREEKGETWFFSERQYGAFSRSFRLPPDADPDKASADLKDGVLTVTVPKVAPNASEAKTVKIRKG